MLDRVLGAMHDPGMTRRRHRTAKAQALPCDVWAGEAKSKRRRRLVGPAGLEPATLCLEGMDGVPPSLSFYFQLLTCTLAAIESIEAAAHSWCHGQADPARSEVQFLARCDDSYHGR